MTPTVQEDPLHHLLRKLVAWLRAQPEWPLVFLANRKQRREASQAVAKMLFTIPRRMGEESPADENGGSR